MFFLIRLTCSLLWGLTTQQVHEEWGSLDENCNVKGVRNQDEDH